MTVCVHEKKKLLSDIIVGDGFPVPKLTIYGQITEKYIGLAEQKYPEIQIKKYVIMPNHIHILAEIYKGPYGTGNPSPTTDNLIAWLKYQTTKEINLMKGTQGVRFWQRSFHDHIIRGEQDYQEIWQYIDENPLRWKLDRFY